MKALSVKEGLLRNPSPILNNKLFKRVKPLADRLESEI